jgi:hypothetical protein
MALIAEGRSPATLRLLARRQVKGRAIVGSREPTVEPMEQLGNRAHCRHALVIDRRQHRAADQDLAARVALPFGVTGARDEAILLRPQTGDAFIERLNSGEDFLGLRHGAPPMTTD